jgi:hypothetical protein
LPQSCVHPEATGRRMPTAQDSFHHDLVASLERGADLPKQAPGNESRTLARTRSPSGTGPSHRTTNRRPAGCLTPRALCLGG